MAWSVLDGLNFYIRGLGGWIDNRFELHGEPFLHLRFDEKTEVSALFIVKTVFARGGFRETSGLHILELVLN